MIKAVIFDWSGVLSDDWEACFRTANDVLEEYGHRALSEKEFREHYELPWTNFYKNLNMEVDITKEYKLWEKKFPKYYHTLKQFPAAKGVLELLKKKGVKVVVLSSHCQKLLEEEIVQDGFEGLSDEGDASNADKRDKVEEFVSENGIEKENTIFVGDMCHDIETARLAGIKSVAVLSGYDTREKLERENPDYIIEGVGELPALIEKMGGKNVRVAANS